MTELKLTDEEVAIVKEDGDQISIDYLGTPVDTQGPIDFEAIKAAINKLGPLRMRSKSSPYTIEVHVTECHCDTPDCSHDIIVVVRRNGVFSIRWMLSVEELTGFDSLEHLRFAVLAGNLIDSCLERQVIEQEIERVLDQHYLDVEPITCFCDACAEHVGKQQLPLNMLLSQMASNLTARIDHISECNEAFGEQVEDAVSNAYDLGYQLGRIYSEYQVKRDIEGDALAGRTFEKLKERRAKSGGEKSTGKRTERRIALLTFMEKLVKESPALLRIGPSALARMASEDAAAADGALWSQGSGQVEEYLGEIRRGEAGEQMQARYLALFPSPKAVAH